MVNLKPYELDYLKARGCCLDEDKQYNDYANKIYVTTNCSFGKLPLNLRDKIRCADYVSHKYNYLHKQWNYRLVFEVVSYKEYDLIAQSVTLSLGFFTDDGGFQNMPFIAPSRFFVSKTDLDRYFKRAYPKTCDNVDVLEHRHYTDENGVTFTVMINKRTGTTSIANNMNLLVDNPNELPIVGTSVCNAKEPFVEEVGIQIAHERWAENWNSWFASIASRGKPVKAKETDNNIQNNNMEDANMPVNNTNNGVTRNYNAEENLEILSLLKKKEWPGVVIGDFKIERTYSDGSKHSWIVLKCLDCGKVYYATKSMIRKGKFSLKCKACGHLKVTEDDCKFALENEMPSLPVIPTVEEVETETEMKTKSYVDVTEIHGDLFNAPVFCHLAHCIPADLSFGGAIAREIDTYYDAEDRLNKLYGDITITPGDVLVDSNVYHLIASPKKFTKAKMEDLENCIATLAQTCYDDAVHYLAMPRIGCGANGLPWEGPYGVKQKIIDIFNEVYEDNINGVDDTPWFPKYDNIIIFVYNND